MTPPRPITAGTIASSTHDELIEGPSLGSYIRVPAHALELGQLPARLSTFRPPRPSMEGITRSTSEASRPAGRGHPTHLVVHAQPGVTPPPGIQHFTVRPGTQDAQRLRSLGQSLLRFSPTQHPGLSHSIAAPAPEQAAPNPRPNFEATRVYIRDFRNAMAEYRRAMYFGDAHRFHEARQSLTQARTAYTMLYAELPTTPAMNGILNQFQGQLDAADARVAAMDPGHHHRSRLA